MGGEDSPGLFTVVSVAVRKTTESSLATTAGEPAKHGAKNSVFQSATGSDMRIKEKEKAFHRFSGSSATRPRGTSGDS